MFGFEDSFPIISKNLKEYFKSLGQSWVNLSNKSPNKPPFKESEGVYSKTGYQAHELTYIFLIGSGSSKDFTDAKGTTVCCAGLFIPLASFASICNIYNT